MALLLNLYLGHLLGDFVLQPGILVIAKRRSVFGLALHVGIIGAVTALILFADLAALWVLVVLAMGAHLLIEVLTIRLRSNPRISGLTVFLIDQGLHIFSLVILVWIGSPLIDVESIRSFGSIIPIPWIALVCAFVGVTFLGSILVFEITNAFGPASRVRQILPYDGERLVGMLERGGAVLAAVLIPAALNMNHPLIPPLLIIAAFVPRTLVALRATGEERAYQMITATSGLMLSALGLAFVAGVTLMTFS